MNPQQQELTHIVIKFAGDSGDGMQLTGQQFTKNTASLGVDISTFPDFPAEIRAPQGTLAGVSGFQLHFSSDTIYTAGDAYDVLVAMNVAALKSNVKGLKKGGKIIANISGFDSKNLRLAGYNENEEVLDDPALNQSFEIVKVDISKMTLDILKDSSLSNKEKNRAKNMFVLGLVYWIYGRDLENTIHYLEKKFAKQIEVLEANIQVLKGGYHFGETSELFQVQYKVAQAKLQQGTYRSITGNQSLSIGLITAAQKSKLKLFLGSYPITPASDILHELSKRKNFDVYTFQAEDEIAAISSAIGASYGGALGVTSTSGPGMSLKTEAIGLAFMLELPLIICNVQRAGPSTGMPTKTEQSDLMQALYSRNGEAPIPILACSRPSDCFETALEAVRIAVEHMTPVILLSDGYIANGAEPWKIPDLNDIIDIHAPFKNKLKEGEANLPYDRDEKFVRPWVIPGTAFMEHRIGGLSKQDKTGNISYDPINHEKMIRLRESKVEHIQESIPLQHFNKGKEQGKLLIIGWGSTYGPISGAVDELINENYSVSHIHLRHIKPFPKNLEKIIRSFDHFLVPEMNTGQLIQLLRSRFLIDAQGLNKIQGIPFTKDEVKNAALNILAIG